MNNTVPIEYGEFVGQPVEVPAMRVAGVPQWQPIETAPKNRTPVLVWWDSRIVGEARYIPEEDTYDFGWWWANEGPGDAFAARLSPEPTHWMPLPAPPGAAPSPITDAPATRPEAEKADAVDAKSRPFGCALAMGVLQSDLYRQLDDVQRAECDELVRRNLEWFKADAAIATLEKPHAE
jgi:hypothetical protein